MNKMLLMLTSITASSFLCSMDSSSHNIKLSPRKSSGSPLQPVTKSRRLTDGDSIQESPVYVRVRSQSRESEIFVKEENIKTKTLQRTSSADKK